MSTVKSDKKNHGFWLEDGEIVSVQAPQEMLDELKEVLEATHIDDLETLVCWQCDPKMSILLENEENIFICLDCELWYVHNVDVTVHEEEIVEEIIDPIEVRREEIRQKRAQLLSQRAHTREMEKVQEKHKDENNKVAGLYRTPVQMPYARSTSPAASKRAGLPTEETGEERMLKPQDVRPNHVPISATEAPQKPTVKGPRRGLPVDAFEVELSGSKMGRKIANKEILNVHLAHEAAKDAAFMRAKAMKAINKNRRPR